MAINSVVLVGRLVRDPDLKQTGSGFPYVNFCVAVDRPYKSGEERQADFVDCTAWRGTAEFISKWFRKGSPIGITGRITTRNYSTQDGQKRKATEVTVDNASFVGSNNGGGNQSNAAPYVEPGCNAAAPANYGNPAYAAPAAYGAPAAPAAPAAYGAPQAPAAAPYGYAYGAQPQAPGAFYNSQPIHPQSGPALVPPAANTGETGDVVTDFGIIVEDDDCPF